MPAGQLLSLVNAMPSPWAMVLKTILAIAGGVYLLLKTFKYVPEGHQALRLRFQTVVRHDGEPVVKKKGLHVMFPFVHSLQVVNVLDRTMGLRSISVLTGDFQAFSVRAAAVFAVTNIYQLSYGAEEPMPRLKAACEDALRKALMAHPPAGGMLDTAAISESFASSITPEAEELGVIFKRLNLQEVKPDSGMAVASAIRALGPLATIFNNQQMTNGSDTQ